MRDYYQRLGVRADAPAAEIKKAYRRLAKQHHPDVTGGDKAREARFKEITEAYEVLSDEKKRAEYDARLRFGASSPFGAGDGRPGAGFPGFPGFGDLFGGARARGAAGDAGGGRFRFETNGEDGADLGSILGDLLGQRGGRAGRPGRGASGRSAHERIADVDLDFALAALGGTTTLVLGKERLAVRIPGGVEDGDRIRVPAKGSALGGPAGGDLLLRLRVRPHPHLRREGADVHLDLPLSIEEAVLGTRADVPTVDGTATLTVPPGSSSGTKLRLRGKGAARKRAGGERGDQIVTTRVIVPQTSDPRVRELLAELSRRAPVPPRKF